MGGGAGMSLKYYGIYLAYPPTTELRGEGLGRHLAAFLKAAGERGDARFVIACPSWMRESLVKLFEDEWVNPTCFDFISPSRKPLLLSAYLFYLEFKRRPYRPSRIKRLLAYLGYRVSFLRAWFLKKIAGTRSVFVIAGIAMILSPLVIIWLVTYLLIVTARGLSSYLSKLRSFSLKQPKVEKINTRLTKIIAQPQKDTFSVFLNSLMMEAEASMMSALIGKQQHVSAWYCPTAFWPHFNNIKGPRLTCVPDVVLADFPVGFARIGDHRMLDNFRQVEKTINGSDHFVTYSKEVKWNTLVDRYHAKPESVHVVPHGVNRLDDLVLISGLPDNEAATDALCRNLLHSVLRKATTDSFSNIFSRSEFRFLFYASQFRPSKNVISLLRAYEYLLRRRYIGHKLLLTGRPEAFPEVSEFIAEHGLENDVLCLHGLTSQELAACYRLADLAVNPSLYEGGCPFTYTEAVSVGTPVVMARIAVTEEVLVDPELQAATLFDPYDWHKMAAKIEWALENRDELYARQRKFYDEVLVNRTWRHVVDDYIAILDQISQPVDRATQEPSAASA